MTATKRNPRTASPRPTARRAGAPVVLVLSASSRPTTALSRANALATRLGAPLRVVGCLAARARPGVFFPQWGSAGALEGMAQEATATKRLWRWCNRTLVTPLSPEAVFTARGDLIGCAVGAARRLGAQLLVLPEGDVSRGSDVTAIVEDSGVSVLVSRPRQSRNAVVAATDLRLERTPVLKEGAAVGQALHAPVTFFHNVAQEWTGNAVMVGPQGETMLPLPVAGTRTRWRREIRLDKAASALGGGFDTKVVGDLDTAAAILRFARGQEADLVVVGHRPHGWLDRLFSPGVAAAVAGGARRSVLVVPLPGL